MDAHQAEQARIIATVMDTGEVADSRPAMVVGS
jgi:2-oxoglutarate dehydrogenase E1 component